MIDLELASLIPLTPLSQAEDKSVVVKPSITVINETEFLILSWTGTSTIGVFINSDGDPVRGTLQWPAHPQAVCMYYGLGSMAPFHALISKQVLTTHI